MRVREVGNTYSIVTGYPPNEKVVKSELPFNDMISFCWQNRMVNTLQFFKGYKCEPIFENVVDLYRELFDKE